MRSIHIPYVSANDELTTDRQIAELIQNTASVQLTEVPWSSFPYKPDVKFSIVHTGTLILLSFKVEEAEVRHVNTAINSSVWEDSCVEFFIGFDDTGYYNFEFNCIGTALVGFGKDRNGRKLLPETLVQCIKCFSSIERGSGSVQWELTVAIPVSVFMYHAMFNLQGQTARANFYKCGDLLPQPHFLAWNRIETAEPDFHQPAFFGDIEFETKVS